MHVWELVGLFTCSSIREWKERDSYLLRGSFLVSTIHHNTITIERERGS